MAAVSVLGLVPHILQILAPSHQALGTSAADVVVVIVIPLIVATVVPLVAIALRADGWTH